MRFHQEDVNHWSLFTRLLHLIRHRNIEGLSYVIHLSTVLGEVNICINVQFMCTSLGKRNVQLSCFWHLLICEIPRRSMYFLSVQFKRFISQLSSIQVHLPQCK